MTPHPPLRSASCHLSPQFSLYLPSPIHLPVILDLHSFPHKFRLNPSFSFYVDSFRYQDILSPGSCNSFLNSILDSSVLYTLIGCVVLYTLLLNYLPWHLTAVEIQFTSPTAVFWHILLQLSPFLHPCPHLLLLLPHIQPAAGWSSCSWYPRSPSGALCWWVSLSGCVYPPIFTWWQHLISRGQGLHSKVLSLVKSMFTPGIAPHPATDDSKQIYAVFFSILHILMSDIFWFLCSLVWYPFSPLEVGGALQGNLLTVWPLLHHCNSARSVCLNICAMQTQERVSEPKNGYVPSHASVLSSHSLSLLLVLEDKDWVCLDSQYPSTSKTAGTQ